MSDTTVPVDPSNWLSERIIRHLLADGQLIGATASELAAALEASPRHIHQILYRLRLAGIVAPKIGETAGRRSPPTVYRLADDWEQHL